MKLDAHTPTIKIPPYWGWSAYTPVIPKLYWDVYSQEERIKRLCKEYDKLTHYASELAQYLNELDGTVKSQLQKALDTVAESIDALEQEWRTILKEIQESSVTWDVQHGYATSSVDAMRDMFNDITVHGITIGDLNKIDSLTVDSLANCGLNVRGLAVMGYWLVSKTELLHYFTFDGSQEDSDPILDVNSIREARVNSNGFVYYKQ